MSSRKFNSDRGTGGRAVPNSSGPAPRLTRAVPSSEACLLRKFVRECDQVPVLTTDPVETELRSDDRVVVLAVSFAYVT